MNLQINTINPMNLQINTIILKRYLFLFSLLLFNIVNAQSQTTPTLEVLYETDQIIGNLRYTEGYTYWEEGYPDDHIYYRYHNGNIASSKQSEEYALCTSVSGDYNYRDFSYKYFSNSPGINYCSRGFLWQENTLLEAPQNIGVPCTGYENFIFVEDYKSGSIYDINTQTEVPINLETELYTYSPTNICSLNDTYLKFKATKKEKSTGIEIGQAIVLYNWKTHESEEIFFSTTFLHFLPDFMEGRLLTFTDDHPTNDFDLQKSYFYDGEKVVFITEGAIINGNILPYLNGVAYVLDSRLYYWEDGVSTLISNDAFEITIEGNILAWFSGWAETRKINFYDGANYSEIAIPGHPEQVSLTLFDGTSFIFEQQNLAQNKSSIITGTHGFIAQIDIDNDGYNSTVDCDDTNAAIHPGAEEIINSGFDENCDGVSQLIIEDEVCHTPISRNLAGIINERSNICLLYTSPSPRDRG